MPEQRRERYQIDARLGRAGGECVTQVIKPETRNARVFQRDVMQPISAQHRLVRVTIEREYVIAGGAVYPSPQHFRGPPGQAWPQRGRKNEGCESKGT